MSVKTDIREICARTPEGEKQRTLGSSKSPRYLSVNALIAVKLMSTLIGDGLFHHIRLKLNDGSPPYIALLKVHYVVQ